jgi:hypothetical protein
MQVYGAIMLVCVFLRELENRERSCQNKMPTIEGVTNWIS